jgi:hypothetical protein
LSRTSIPVTPFVPGAKVIAVVDRPQDSEDEAAMRFFGGEEGNADLSQG